MTIQTIVVTHEDAYKGIKHFARESVDVQEINTDQGRVFQITLRPGSALTVEEVKVWLSSLKKKPSDAKAQAKRTKKNRKEPPPAVPQDGGLRVLGVDEAEAQLGTKSEAVSADAASSSEDAAG